MCHDRWSINKLVRCMSVKYSNSRAGSAHIHMLNVHMRRMASLVRNSHLRSSSHPQRVALSAYSAVKQPQCSRHDWGLGGNNPINQTYHIRNHHCSSDFAERMNIYRERVCVRKKRSNWFSLMQMSYYQMRLALVRFEVLSERLFVPSSFADHLVDRLTVLFFFSLYSKNLPKGMQRARLMSYLLGPALERLELC